MPRGERTPRPVAEGRLRLYADRLELTGEDGEVRWAMRMDALKAVSVEIGSVLQVRDADSLYQVDPDNESTIKWSRFLWPWRQKAWGRI